MLRALEIRDFVIVESASLELQKGFTVLTGETGAGKSIIVDAIGAILGDRLTTEVIREGAPRASVEAIFELDPSAPGYAALHELLDQNGLLEDDQQLILSREIQRTGRGIARVNGRAVTVGLLGQIGEQLVDVHGQTEHLSLLRVREHLDFLDRAGGLWERRSAFGSLVADLRGVQAQRRQLQEEIRRAARERELLTHEIREIEAAAPRPGEDLELEAQRRRLRNVVRLREAVERSMLALEGNEDSPGASGELGVASSALREGARMDPDLAPATDTLERLAAEADEVGRGLRDYLENLEADPRALEELELRILALGDLKRKYGDSVEAVLEYLARARERLETAERGEELLEELARREADLRQRAAELAWDLSQARAEVAKRIGADVERELHDLNLPHARFEARVEQHPAADGLAYPPSGGGPVAFDASGVDRVEFLFSANPGEPPRGLARIASGGELARVALALKTALSRADQRATLIFDEVDVGVGGRTAPVVGRKLWGLATTHQVLCVTHMPQVAAFADHHLVVAKQIDAQRTSTEVTRLDRAARAQELAAMLGGGSGGAALANAGELLDSSEQFKAAATGPNGRRGGGR